MKDRIITATALVAWIALVSWTAWRQVQEERAMRCAMRSERTDQAIADCYTMRGLPCPTDICPR